MKGINQRLYALVLGAFHWSTAEIGGSLLLADPPSRDIEWEKNMIVLVAPYSYDPLVAPLGAVRKMESIINVLSDFGDIILVNSAHNETGWYHRDVRKRKIGRTTVLEYLPRRWPGRKPGKFLNLFEIGSIIRDILYQYGKPQILWLYNPYAFEACFAIKLSRLHSCPVVLELEDAPLARKRGLNPKPWLDNLAYKRLLPCVDYAFCVNKALAACLEEHKIKTFLLPGLLAQSFLEKIQKGSPFAGQKITILKLDCSKAYMLLKWRDVWDSDTTFKKTVNWYKNYYEKNKILTEEDLNAYIEDAREKGIEWAGGNAE